MKTILVTGANGQLGKCIAETFSKQPFELILLSSKELDISNPETIEEFFKLNRIDWCINCAAFTKVDLAESQANKANMINAVAVQLLATACKHNDVSLIQISTDFIFDGKLQRPYTEEDQPIPLNIYGQSKLEGEIFIRETLTNYYIFRTSWLFSEFGSNFVNTMLDLSRTKDELFVVNDQVGSPTYAMDLAKMIFNLINGLNLPFGTYNFCNEGETTWYNFARQIFKQQRDSVVLKPIETSDLNSLAKRPRYSVLDNAKIKRYLQTSIPKWEDSLRTCLDRKRSNNKK